MKKLIRFGIIVFFPMLSLTPLMAQQQVDDAQVINLNLTLNIKEIEIKEDRDIDNDGEFHFWRTMLGVTTRIPTNGEIVRKQHEFIRPGDPNLQTEPFWVITWQESANMSRLIQFQGWENDSWPDSDDNMSIVSTTLDLTSFEFLTTNTDAKLECSDYIIYYTVRCAPVIQSETHPDSTLTYEKSAISLSWERTMPAVGITGYSYELNEQSGTEPDELLEGTHTSYSANLAADSKSHTYWFHIRVQDKLGFWSNTGHYKINTGLYKLEPVTQINSDTPQSITNFKLFPGFPNPFNSQTTIRYEIDEPGMVSLEIYSLQGRRVKTLVREHQSVGIYQTCWDSTDENAVPVASGVYFVRLQMGQQFQIKKISLLR